MQRNQFEHQLSIRKIASSCNISRATVSDYLNRFAASGLEWPLSSNLDETTLDQQLFPVQPPASKRKMALPDWSEIHQELRKPGVTLMVLWQEYKTNHPDGYQYSWFSDRYREWRTHLDVVMRQNHIAGDKLFIDYAGQTVTVVNQHTGEVQQAQVFIATLGASSYTYAEATLSQSLPDWIGSHVRTFEYRFRCKQPPDSKRATLALRVPLQTAPPIQNVLPLPLVSHSSSVESPAMDFSGRHYPKDLILQTVRWYLRYSLSYRDMEEILEERGVEINHTTPYRWVQEYAPQLEAEHRKRRKVCGTSWRMDETYIKVKGEWVYLYRAVDTEGDTVDFLLTKKRDKKAATRFFKKAIRLHGAPEKVTIDKSGANTAALNDLNEERKKAGEPGIEIRQIKYLNNLVEQDHRGIKRRTKPMLGFQSFKTARRTLKGVELCHMIHKGQYDKTESANDWEYFYSLAG